MNDDSDIRAVLERGAGLLSPLDPTVVRARAGRRRQRRRGVLALGIVAAVLATITASLLVGTDEETRELDTVTTMTRPTTMPGPTTTTALSWPPDRDSLPPFSGTVPPTWEEDGSLESQLLRERATGWTPVMSLDGGLIAFRPTGGLLPGDVTEAVDADLVLVGYWMYPGILVDRVTFEDPEFDWEALIRANLADPTESRVIEQIEAVGGLDDPIRIAEARR
jgi:hypothetical protein